VESCACRVCAQYRSLPASDYSRDFYIIDARSPLIDIDHPPVPHELPPTTISMGGTRPGDELTTRQLLRVLRERVVSILFVGALPTSTPSTDTPPASTDLLILLSRMCVLEFPPLLIVDHTSRLGCTRKRSAMRSFIRDIS